MYRILKIGLDVHSTNYTICILESLLGQNDKVWLNTQIEPDYREVIKLIGKVKQKIGKCFSPVTSPSAPVEMLARQTCLSFEVTVWI